MATISFRNVVKKYDNTTVIPNLDLEIQDKEFLVLVGPSGCGKSTTLRMIAGLESISAGELRIGERIVNDIAPKDRDIAMVFQSYALYPHMSVYKNMAFALKLRKMDKKEIDEKVHQVARILDIEEYLDRKPKALSGGQRQRVALGRAMVREPSVFLLDEPLSNLDAKLRTQMRSEITSLHKHLKTTFVYVTHDQTEAMTMGDRIAVMKDGYLQQVDTPENLYQHPCNLFVAGFIGSPQMNFIECKLTVNALSAYVSFMGYNVEIPLKPGMEEYNEKTVILGVRPEDFHCDEQYMKKYAGNEIQLPLLLSEMMGAEKLLYSAINSSKIIIKVPSSIPFSREEKFETVIDTEKIHLFDKKTELLICD